jgi:hypothetical protein
MKMLLSVPSWVIPGTYIENLRFLDSQRDIAGVELLFFIYDEEIKKLLKKEIEGIREFSNRFIFTAHLPEGLNGDHEELVELLSPMVRHFIVHPPKKIEELKARALLVNSWEAKYKTPDGRPRFLAENTNPGQLEAFLPHLESGAGLCMDTGHLLLEGRNPAQYLARYGDRIGEIHLHGLDREKAALDGHLPDHRPVRTGAPWFEEIFPLLRDFKGIINLEVFSWKEAAESIRVIKGM